MSELKFYKFIHKNKIEYHWRKNDSEKQDVIFFVPFNLLEEFSEILGFSFFDDGGHTIIIQYNYACFWALEICEYFGFDDLENIFEKEEE